MDEPACKEFVPSTVYNTCVANNAQLQENIASLEMILAEGWQGNAKENMDEANDAMDKAGKHLTKCDLWLDEFQEKDQ